MSDTDVIWATDDKKLVKRARKIGRDERAALNLCVEESLAGWNRLPVVMTYGEYSTMVGIALREKDWSWEVWHKEQKAKDPDRFYFGSPKPDAPPPGWRKRVKDDYFSPPLKGGGDDAETARALLRTYRRIPNMRQILVEVGEQVMHFTSLRLVTPGIRIHKGTLYIRHGEGFTIKDERFRQVRLSEYLAEVEGK